MSTSLYKEEEADYRLKGDTLTVDGTTVMTGAVTMSSTLDVSGAASVTNLSASGTATVGTLKVTSAASITGLTANGAATIATIAGGLSLSSPAVTSTKTLTISSKMTTHSGITIGAPSGTTAGTVWTSGAPALHDGQMFVVMTCGSTAYRWPVWADA